MFERQVRTVQLGPARSGMTAMLGGLGLAAEAVWGDVGYNAAMAERRRCIAEREFPPPTTNGEPQWLEVEQESSGLLSRRRRLETVDYGGTLLRDVLAGVEGPDVEIDPPERADSWADARRNVKRLSDETPEEGLGEAVVGAIWDCVRHADRIVLTVPLDDFLGPIVARGNERDYAGVVWDDDYDDEDDLRDALDISENAPITAVPKFTYDGETFYIPRAGVRSTPDEYLPWYQNLLIDDRFDDTDFVFVVTKADHALHDWRGPTSSKPAVSDYGDFREHVAEEVLFEASGFLRSFATTSDFYPVWYDIEAPTDGSELRIRGDVLGSPPLLRGARRVLDRLE